MWHAPTLPAPSGPIWAHVQPRTQGRARTLRCLRQTSKKPLYGTNNVPYVLKCVVLRVSFTFYRTLQIGHPQQKWLSLQEPHRNSVQKGVLYSPPSFFLSWFLRQLLELQNLGLNVNLKILGLSVMIHPLFAHYLFTIWQLLAENDIPWLGA